MAKNDKSSIVKVQPAATALAALPDYLRNAPVEGTDDLREVVRPPFLKIIQKQADDGLLQQFSVGDLITVPAQTTVAAHRNGEPEIFRFVPLFFYVEYAVWSPLEARGSGIPMILERTADKNSEIARRSVDFSRMTGGQYKLNDGSVIDDVRYVQHLNFVIALVGHALGDEPMLVSFARGENKTGVKLASMIRMRRASIYDCVFEANVCPEPRKNSKGSWYGLDIRNPTPPVSPWVTAEQHEAYKGLHAAMADHFKAGRLRAEYEVPESVPDDSETPQSREF